MYSSGRGGSKMMADSKLLHFIFLFHAPRDIFDIVRLYNDRCIQLKTYYV
jgi:hypothetical protein